jgi:hypothetical protein
LQRRGKPEKIEKDKDAAVRILEALSDKGERDFVKKIFNCLPSGWQKVLDEYTRECLSIDVERSITARYVISTLEYLFAVRGAPQYIRSDNGPEFVADAVKSWLVESGVGTLYIEKGSPWENAYSESFNSRFRDEFLNGESFATVKEAKVLAERHRLDYNHRRPHSSLDYATPAAFATACLASGSASSGPSPQPNRTQNVESYLSRNAK